ncbi:MAG: hypothetical protein K6A38_07815 [Lachnospiraceae bacterium]|nr:hypothetical protein [Lachnospiraceae bacterium]
MSTNVLRTGIGKKAGSYLRQSIAALLGISIGLACILPNTAIRSYADEAEVPDALKIFAEAVNAGSVYDGSAKDLFVIHSIDDGTLGVPSNYTVSEVNYMVGETSYDPNDSTTISFTEAGTYTLTVLISWSTGGDQNYTGSYTVTNTITQSQPVSEAAPEVQYAPAAEAPVLQDPQDGDGDEGDRVPTPEEVADKQLDDALNSYKKSLDANGNNGSAESKKTVILDLGNSTSFSQETYTKLDSASSYGIPVTINYVHNGLNCSLTIPANLPFKLHDLCDASGFLGFEKLKGYLLVAGCITPEGLTEEEQAVYKTALKELQDKVGFDPNNLKDAGQVVNGNSSDRTKTAVETRSAAATFINAGADMLAAQGFSQAANAVTMDAAEKAKNGSASATAGSFTPFAAFGGSNMRAESG